MIPGGTELVVVADTVNANFLCWLAGWRMVDESEARMAFRKRNEMKE